MQELFVERFFFHTESGEQHVFRSKQSGLLHIEPELPHGRIAVSLAHELKRRVPNIVRGSSKLDTRGSQKVVIDTEERHAFGQNGISHNHEIAGIPYPGFKFCKTFHDPQGRTGLYDRGKNSTKQHRKFENVR